MPNPITAMILAGGMSKRFGAGNKLLHSLNGHPLIETTVELAIQSPVNEIVVVTGFESHLIGDAIQRFGVRLTINPDFEAGLASSIVCGVKSTALDHSFLIWPGDMPYISIETVTRVIREGRPDNIVVPVTEGRRGHPVFFGVAFRQELMLLEGLGGARPVLERHAASVVDLPVEDPGILLDVDTQDDLRRSEDIL